MIGTSGKRMLANVARYADYWDAGQPPENIPALAEQVDSHCREIGRDPAEIRKAISAYFAPSSNPNAPMVNWELSRQETEDAFREHVAAYAAVGVRTFLFNILYDAPNDNLEHVAHNVIPELREAFKRGEIG
jgi:alkanesulfonate monooxygenase SsuD/methylene tetrahydromethanopterin reductase-like flavin-dependent oxidoreductase (luciferase family)